MPSSFSRVVRAACGAIVAWSLAACGDAPTDPTAAPATAPPAASASRVFTFTLTSSDSVAFGAALLELTATGGAVDSVTVAGGTTDQYEGRTLVVMPAETRRAVLRVVAASAVSAVRVVVRESARGDGAPGTGDGAVIVEPGA